MKWNERENFVYLFKCIIYKIEQKQIQLITNSINDKLQMNECASEI